MISYRRSLEQIGIPRTDRVAYSDFYSRPRSLSKAMGAMQPPGEFNQLSDNFVDAKWTEAINGCATDGKHWFFTSNQERTSKLLHVFEIGTGVSLGPRRDTFIFAADAVGGSLPAEALAVIGPINHIGQLEAFEDRIYISHFNDDTQLIILRNDGGKIRCRDRPLLIPRVTSPTTGRSDKVQFQCIVPWDRTFLTCFGDGDIDELFVHDLDDGTVKGAIRLQKPISGDYWVQGAALSDYGHLFISASFSDKAMTALEEKADSTIQKLEKNARRIWDELAKGRNRVDPPPDDNRPPRHIRGDTQPIHIVSPLNGKELAVIPVRAEGSWEGNHQELEGCCYRPIPLPDGSTVELHVVLSDNKWPAKDNIFFKSYQRIKPAV